MITTMGTPNVATKRTVALAPSPIWAMGREVTALERMPMRLSPSVSQSTTLRRNVLFSGYCAR